MYIREVLTFKIHYCNFYIYKQYLSHYTDTGPWQILKVSTSLINIDMDILVQAESYSIGTESYSLLKATAVLVLCKHKKTFFVLLLKPWHSCDVYKTAELLNVQR